MVAKKDWGNILGKTKVCMKVNSIMIKDMGRLVLPVKKGKNTKWSFRMIWSFTNNHYNYHAQIKSSSPNPSSLTSISSSIFISTLYLNIPPIPLKPFKN